MDVETLVAELGDLAAGGSFEGGSSVAQRRHFQQLVRGLGDRRVRVVEIGFNAGAGSAAFLTATDAVEVVAFDLGLHEYVAPCSAHLSDRFGDRFSLVLGDSRETLPAFAAERGAWADLVLVDGGHTEEVARSDVEWGSRAATAEALIVVDDLLPQAPWGVEVQRVWDDLVLRGVLVRPQVWCSVEGDDDPHPDDDASVPGPDRRWGVAQRA